MACSSIVQLADRDVEIVADRGLAARVSQPEWEAVCRLMEEHFRAGRFEAGAIGGGRWPWVTCLRATIRPTLSRPRLPTINC